MPSKWNIALRGELDKPYWNTLQQFVRNEREHHTIYPPHNEVFNALHLTPLDTTRVVILGQDPYHGPHQAHGLAFSVRQGIAIPPSLANIFKELHADLGIPPPKDGCLEHWASQGVLLLNATLTVRAGNAGSHSGKGWETFTDAIISTLGKARWPIVFVLWGNYARKKRQLITQPHHRVIESVHPSPLSAYAGFFGSRPFSAINAALEDNGSTPIDWTLP
ncbi:MAG: uracil-DNA glycosylase [Ilumatobacteraceae bacterium]